MMMCSGHGRLTTLTWRQQMAWAHNTRVHVCVGVWRERGASERWMGRSEMGLSEVLKGMQTLKKEQSSFLGCAGVNLCSDSLTVNTIKLTSKSLATADWILFSSQTKHWIYFPIGFFFFFFLISWIPLYFAGTSLLMSAKHTPASCFSSIQTTLCCVYRVSGCPPTPPSAPLRGNLLLCAIHSCWHSFTW